MRTDHMDCSGVVSGNAIDEQRRPENIYSCSGPTSLWRMIHQSIKIRIQLYSVKAVLYKKKTRDAALATHAKQVATTHCERDRLQAVSSTNRALQPLPPMNMPVSIAVSAQVFVGVFLPVLQ